mmetsp:Transcript_39509/g.122554  ORF Transcript_39509/g.122554 Transcript_39509/m.122554 type:complete len:397 (-) Transcript_39509:54-1244(-)
MGAGQGSCRAGCGAVAAAAGELRQDPVRTSAHEEQLVAGNGQAQAEAEDSDSDGPLLASALEAHRRWVRMERARLAEKLGLKEPLFGPYGPAGPDGELRSVHFCVVAGHKLGTLEWGPEDFEPLAYVVVTVGRVEFRSGYCVPNGDSPTWDSLNDFTFGVRPGASTLRIALLEPGPGRAQLLGRAELELRGLEPGCQRAERLRLQGGGGELEVSLLPQAERAEALQEALYLSGQWAQWSTGHPDARLVALPQEREGVARLRCCVKMTSPTFSFQVFSSRRSWQWRLYPRDAKGPRFSHNSKGGRLVEGQRDAVAVALGDRRRGRGRSFHVVEEGAAKDPVVVTVWVEVPACLKPDGLALDAETVEGARVWYTKEDTAVQYTGGDGVALHTRSSTKE